MNNDVRKNIAISFSNLRFPLMIGVVINHCAITDSGNQVMENVTMFCSIVLPVSCVPIFFLISGYFFFANVRDFSLQVYKDKVKRRIYTLVLPYVFANIFMILCYAFGHYFLPQYINPENFNVLQYSFKDFVRAFWSIDGFPICYPLWYIRNLFVICLCSPLFYFLIKQRIEIKFTILLALALVRLFFDLPILLGPIYFYLGAMLSCDDIYTFLHHLNKRFVLIILSIVTITAAYFNYITDELLFVKLQIITMTILTLWISYLLSEKNGMIKSSIWGSTFFIYLYHAFPVFVINEILLMIIEPSGSFSFITTYILSIIMSIMSCMFAYYILGKYSPSFLALLTGGRNKWL